MKVPVGDLISRNLLRQKLQEHHDSYIDTWGDFNNIPPNDRARVDEINICIAMVVSEPPVVKKGEWIKVDDDTYKCSNCKIMINHEKYNYCPFCGSNNQ